MNIYLIRHGRQCDNRCNVNVPLSEEGREQARLVGERLQSYDIDAVWSSNLIRAKETADIINKYINKPRYIDDRFREAEFGDLTGLSTEEMKAQHGQFLARRAQMEVDEPYPGGGENCQAIWHRVSDGLTDLVRTCQEQGYENVVLVTHGGAMRALFTGLMGAPFAKWLVYGRVIENCSISHLLYDEDMGTYHIERINDYAHLEGKDHLLRKHFGAGFFSNK